MPDKLCRQKNRSCFERIDVRGYCYFFYPYHHEMITYYEGTANERTHLLEDPVRSDPAPLRPARSAIPPRKPDEQSALSRILQETATNVIDVGALGSHALETHEYNERVKLYQARLGGAAGAPVGATTLPKPKLLRDIPTSDKTNILQQEPISTQDKELISSTVKKAASAMSDLRVEHREDLVVPFRIP